MNSKKLLSIILVMVMMLSMVSFAGAASFPDVSGSTDAAVTRLAGLGILAGYPDGTFKPANNITRAEFAKVAVLAMGLETTANLLVNVPSKFSDVQKGKWFTGYVNLATNQGILQGYPDGKFRPDANITEAEAITIILRLLGYNDNLPGNWPFDYIVKGDNLKLIPTGFNASAPAKRGGVAVLVAGALTKGLVTWNKDTGFSAPAGSLIASSFTGTVSGVLDVTAVELATGTAKYHSLNTLNVSKDVKVSGGSFGAGLVNHKVITTTKTIDNTVVIVAVEVQSTTVSGKVTVVNGKNVTIGGTVVVFGDTLAVPAVNAEVTAFIYDGKAYKTTAIAAPLTGIVTGKRSTTHTDAAGTHVTNYVTIGTVEKVVAADAAISRNGATTTLANIMMNDSVEYKEANGAITMLSAWNKTVEGVVNSWAKSADGKYTTITVDGVAHSVATTFDAATTVPVGVKAKFSVNVDNKITAMLTAETAATSVVGTLATTSIGSSVEGAVYYVALTNGVSYDITTAVTTNAMFKNTTTATFANLFAKDGAVKISYNAAGKVNKVEVFGPSAEVTYAVADAVKKTGTTFTHNGKAETTLTTGADVYRITWDGVTGTATAISSAKFSATGKVVTAKGTTAVGTTVTNYITVDSVNVNFASGAVVFKNGVASNFNAIALSDVVKYAVDTTGNIVYLEATTPTTP